MKIIEDALEPVYGDYPEPEFSYSGGPVSRDVDGVRGHITIQLEAADFCEGGLLDAITGELCTEVSESIEPLFQAGDLMAAVKSFDKPVEITLKF